MARIGEADANSKGYVRFYWSWYENESTKQLLKQLTQILEDDDAIQNEG